MSDRIFSGGEGLAPGSMERYAYEIMMKSELRNGNGAYEIGNAGAAASGPSFGPFQYDVGANKDGRRLLESIAASATDDHGQRVINDRDMDNVKSHIYKPFSTFTETDRTVYTQMKPKLDAALSSDLGMRAVNADFVSGIQKKVSDMNAAVDGMTTEPNKAFIQHSDVAKLILIDTKNQYGKAVNDGLKEFIDRTKDNAAMNMPGRSGNATIKVNGDFGLDDMIRYKLETQYGQSDQGARDVLRRISHCVEAVGVDNVKASLSAEDKSFLETGLEKFLKDHGRDAKILGDPQLKALAELGDRDRQQGHVLGAKSVLHEGSKGDDVKTLQSSLATLGYTDAQNVPLLPDGDFGSGTKAALKKFQGEHNLTTDGIAGKDTTTAIQEAMQTPSTLADPTHPGNGMYLESLGAVYRLDAQLGRTPDAQSENFAAAAATAAKNSQMTGVDHVVLNNNGSQAFVVQGALDSPTKRYAQVDVAQAVATPVAQSSAQWQQNAPQVAPAQTAPTLQQPQNPPQAQPAQPAI